MKSCEFPIRGYFHIRNENDWAIAQSFMFSIGYLWRTERNIKYVEYTSDKIALIWDQTGLTFSTTLKYSLLDELRLYEVKNMYFLKQSRVGHFSGMSYGI
jgi:c-di-AMP phosphodiesterase-like protein